MSLDDRLRDGLRSDVDPMAPDTERSLREIRRRAEGGPGMGPLLAAIAGLVLITVLVIGMVPVAGPRVSPSPPAPSAASVTPGPSALPDALSGTSWSVTLLSTDPGVADLGMAGDWTLSLGEDASLVVGPPNGFQTSRGAAPSRTLYASSDGRFLTTLFAPDFGPSCAGSGDFQVAIEPTRLVFTGTDTCQPRDVLLTTHPWTATR
jgi:hypothetical protein